MKFLVYCAHEVSIPNKKIKLLEEAVRKKWGMDTDGEVMFEDLIAEAINSGDIVLPSDDYDKVKELH